MKANIIVHLAVLASATFSVTLAKSAGLRTLFDNFFDNNDATDKNGDLSLTDDRTCVFKWSSLSCEPKDRCSLQYQFGDITPSQACRVTDTGDHTKEPQQIHLAYAGKEPGTGMAISWATFSLEESPAVWIGTSKTTIAIVKTARIETKSYYKDDDYSLYNYHAVVTGLKPYTEYFYKVGNATNPKAQSTVSSFMTARSSGDKSPFVVAVLGDMGTEKYSIATNKYLNSLVGKVDFVFHIGDIAYADNAFLKALNMFGFFFEETWNKYMNSLSKVMRRMAYMVVVGNHEAECHSPVCIRSTEKKNQLGNYTAFNTRFKMPSHECGGALNMWYSFVYGLMHVVACSSETDFLNPPSNAYYTNRKYGNFGNQLAWLEADLKAAHANRANVPWIVVGMHRPIYSLYSCDADGTPTGVDSSLELQKAFEKLLDQDGRTYTNPCAPVHVVTGHAGCSEGLNSYKKAPSPKWLAAKDDSHYGITMLSVTATNLTVTMIEAATEKVYDEFSIIKKKTTQTQTDY
ncbi:unnamed protein product [Peronospora belbahrii]|uniref:Purple acid phosphatase n=1 Tax=Peronospora belbahrii TaxID=622444 RepID=A0ABN8CKV1_9STRA|nr:unnamed protein product [Peronospora belbahrii]